jgi:hypothetical protein
VFPTLKGLQYSAPVLLTNCTCLRMSSSLIARIRSSISHVSSHGCRERSNTCRCYQIYCLLTLFTAGLRQNAVFSFTLAESPLLFSLTHPARAGQQLEWTCDRTSEPPQVLTASLVCLVFVLNPPRSGYTICGYSELPVVSRVSWKRLAMGQRCPEID